MARVVRILRVLRIIKRADKLQIIFETIVMALPAMGSLGALLLLFIFLFTIIGMQCFGEVKLQSELTDHLCGAPQGATYGRVVLTVPLSPASGLPPNP